MDSDNGAERKPVIDGVLVTDVWTIVLRTGIRQVDVERLIETGALPGAVLSDSGAAFGVTEELVPTTEDLLALGARRRGSDGPEPRPPAVPAHDADDASTWRMEW